MNNATVNNATVKEGGRALLARKLNGYVSFVRGENPFTFPLRIFPGQDTFGQEYIFSSTRKYPTKQLFTGQPITEPLKYTTVYLTQMSDEQESRYLAALSIRESFEGDATDQTVFGVHHLRAALRSLTLSLPTTPTTKLSDHTTCRIANNTQHSRYGFEYSKLSITGRMFNREQLYKYSCKMNSVCDIIERSTGIVVVYMESVDEGAIPFALALEERGLIRWNAAGGDSCRPMLHYKQRESSVNAKTMRPPNMADSRPDDIQNAQYCILSTDQTISPNNSLDMATISQPENRDGIFVKVVILTRLSPSDAGLVLRNVRQIHVLDPWYNMQRIETDVFSRAIYHSSHCDLQFEQRNCEIYLHATLSARNETRETADLYCYRMAERKSAQLGQVTRLLKEVAVDCHLQSGQQTNLTVEELMSQIKDHVVPIRLASRNDVYINYAIGDRDYSPICDNMKCGGFTCAAPLAPEGDQAPSFQELLQPHHLSIRRDKLLGNIRDLFREQSAYKGSELIRLLNLPRTLYSVEEIYDALTFMSDRQTEIIFNKLNHPGYIINRDDVYAFQPAQTVNTNISMAERDAAAAAASTIRSKPTDTKHIFLPVTARNNNNKMAAAAATAASRRNNMNADTEEDNTSSSADILQTLNENLEVALLRPITDSPPQSNTWYDYVRTTFVWETLVNRLHIQPDKIRQYVADHFMDTISFADKRSLAAEVLTQTNDTHALGPAGEYFTRRIVKLDAINHSVLVLQNDNNPVEDIDDDPTLLWRADDAADNAPPTTLPWMILSESSTEAERDNTQRALVSSPIIQHIYRIIDSEVANIIGYFQAHANKPELMQFTCRVFGKLSEQMHARTIILLHQTTSKQVLLTLLNLALHSGVPDDRVFSMDDLYQVSTPMLAVLIELVLRHNTDIHHLGKRWYFTQEERVVWKLETRKHPIA